MSLDVLLETMFTLFINNIGTGDVNAVAAFYVHPFHEFHIFCMPFADNYRCAK